MFDDVQVGAEGMVNPYCPTVSEGRELAAKGGRGDLVGDNSLGEGR